MKNCKTNRRCDNIANMQLLPVSIFSFQSGWRNKLTTDSIGKRQHYHIGNIERCITRPEATLQSQYKKVRSGGWRNYIKFEAKKGVKGVYFIKI